MRCRQYANCFTFYAGKETINLQKKPRQSARPESVPKSLFFNLCVRGHHRDHDFKKWVPIRQLSRSRSEFPSAPEANRKLVGNNQRLLSLHEAEKTRVASLFILGNKRYSADQKQGNKRSTEFPPQVDAQTASCIFRKNKRKKRGVGWHGNTRGRDFFAISRFFRV